jgi:lysozyme
MEISENGLAVVKAFEGCHRAVGGRPGYFKAYKDPVGVLTIGYGHTNHHKPRFNADTVWSSQQCAAVLADDMEIFEKHVARTAGVPLAQYEFDALVSWAFNTGGPAHATLWKKLRKGDKAAIPGELAKWDKAGGNVLSGLTRRRSAEAELWKGNIAKALKIAGAKRPPSKPISKPIPPKLDADDIEADPPNSGPLGKILRSKISWASLGTFLTSAFGVLTDWRVAAVIIGGVLAAYIIYLRSQKP